MARIHSAAPPSPNGRARSGSWCPVWSASAKASSRASARPSSRPGADSVAASLPALPPAAGVPAALAGASDSSGIAARPASGPEGLVERFLARQTDSTRRAYGRDLPDFAGWLGAASAQQAAEWLCSSRTPGPVNRLVHDYVSHLHQRGLAGTTINRRMA